MQAPSKYLVTPSTPTSTVLLAICLLMKWGSQIAGKFGMKDKLAESAREKNASFPDLCFWLLPFHLQSSSLLESRNRGGMHEFVDKPECYCHLPNDRSLESLGLRIPQRNRVGEWVGVDMSENSEDTVNIVCSNHVTEPFTKICTERNIGFMLTSLTSLFSKPQACRET